MKFKTDENLPAEVVDLLRREGHDAMSAVDQQLGGHPDTELAAVCQAEHRVMITLDLDFSDIRSYPPEDYFGIIILRPSVQTVAAILRLTSQAMALLVSESPIGRLWVVEDHQVRIRGDNS